MSLTVAVGFAAGIVLVVTLLVLAARAKGEGLQPLPAVDAVFEFLKRKPFILLFLTMAGGYSLGHVSVKGLSLGPTAGSLVVGMGLSLWASARHDVSFEVPSFASDVFFNLFMFAIGMTVRMVPSTGRSTAR